MAENCPLPNETVIPEGRDLSRHDPDAFVVSAFAILRDPEGRVLVGVDPVDDGASSEDKSRPG